MQTTNAIYKSIILSGKYIVQYKVEIAGVTYNQNQIYLNFPEETSALFDKFSIGNAVAGSLTISLVPTGTIPAMSEIDVYYRVGRVDRTLWSSWMPKGKYFIDTRKTNKDGVITFEAYDAMLKTEYVFMESGSWTSTTADNVVDMVATDIGVNVNADTESILQNNPMDVPNVPVIGEDGTTGREMLKAIATMYGGNFIIDELGELKLIQLAAPAKTIDIGKLATAIDIAPAFPAIDRVIIKLDEKTGYRSPDVTDATWDAMTGRILEAYCPWTSQAVADAVLDVVDGFIYQPYETTGATIDPACQLGDGITINGTTSMIYKQVLHLDPRCAADCSAPFDEEVNHEYPYRSAAQRRIDEAVTQEDLATAGRTTINGSNIHSGTIKLGGDNNGNGQMEIYNEDDELYGHWDKDNFTIWDDTVGLHYDTAKLRVIRKDDVPDTKYGVFIGTGQLWEQFFPDQYPNECTPFIQVNGTQDYTSDSSDTGSVNIYPNNVSLSDSNGNFVNINATPSDATTGMIATKTDNNSTANLSSFTVHKWGRVVQVTLHLTNVNYANHGDVMWEGDISHIYGNLPVDTVTTSGVNGANFCIGQLYGDTVNEQWHIAIRAVSGYQANWTANLSFTFLV